MPKRVRKSRKTRDEEFKPSATMIASEQAEIQAEEEAKVTKPKELTDFLEQNAGNMECFRRFNNLLKHSSGSRRLINQLIKHVVSLSASEDWKTKVLLAISQNLTEPRKRIAESMFFPSNESEQRVIYYLNKAQEQMDVCVFTITNNHLADALLRAKDRGVAVRVISDDECMKMMGSDVQRMGDMGIPFRVDPDEHAHMHNKFVVIDDNYLLTGSFNWTAQAVHKNQENLVAVDDPDLIRDFKQEFNKLWEQFKDVVPPKIEPRVFGRKKKEEKKEEEKKEEAGQGQ